MRTNLYGLLIIIVREGKICKRLRHFAQGGMIGGKKGRGFPMIYTVTLNPSLDYRMDFGHLRLGEL